jgi:mRNA interferase MazF
LKRGDLITIAPQGDYGKPRPAVVVQDDLIAHTDSVLVSPLTSELAPSSLYRVRILSDRGTSLLADSDIMADKTQPIRRVKCGPVFGRASDETMAQLSEALMLILGLDAA